jgi:hypothetical protein
MSVQVSPTPNPAAMKFMVGRPVGGPATVRPNDPAVEGFLAQLVAIDGVASVFFTANFLTITKTPPADWDTIVAEAVSILEAEFSG